MTRYIGKRVSYQCDHCKTQFTLSNKSIDHSVSTRRVFCSEGCASEFYESNIRFCLFTAHKEQERICHCGYVIHNNGTEGHALINTVINTGEKPSCIQLLKQE